MTETWNDAMCRAYADNMRRVVPHDHRRWARRIEGQLAGVHATATIAEIACGPGFLLVELGRLRPAGHLIALDSAPEMLRIASEEARTAGLTVETVECSAARSSLLDASVDVAVCKQLLNCLDEPSARRDVVQEMTRILRPGGLAFVIDFDAGASPWAARAITVFIRLTAGASFARDFQAAWGRRLDRDTVDAWMRDAQLKMLEPVRSGVNFMLVGRKR